MGSPFRSSEDTALRRVEALERENAALRREVDRLRAPSPQSVATRQRTKLAGAASGIVLAVYVVGGLFAACLKPSGARARAAASTAATTTSQTPAYDDRSPTVFYVKTPSPTRVDLHGAAMVDGRRIAVGGAGTIVADEALEDVSSSTELLAVSPAPRGADRGGALAVGRRGSIFRRNGTLVPARWAAEPSGVTADLYGVVAHGGMAWAVGDRGAIVVKPIAGSHWVGEANPSSRDLRSIAAGEWFVAAVGAEGTVLRRTLGEDGVWAPLDPGTSADLEAVTIDGEDIWVAGREGKLLHRNAAGRWESLPVRTQETLRSVTVMHKGARPIVVATGDNGVMVVRENDHVYVEYASGVDLFACAQTERGGFAVGRDGTIVGLKLF